jgi:hypothetical protein
MEVIRTFENHDDVSFYVSKNNSASVGVTLLCTLISTSIFNFAVNFWYIT